MPPCSVGGCRRRHAAGALVADSRFSVVVRGCGERPYFEFSRRYGSRGCAWLARVSLLIRLAKVRVPDGSPIKLGASSASVAPPLYQSGGRRLTLSGLTFLTSASPRHVIAVSRARSAPADPCAGAGEPR